MRDNNDIDCNIGDDGEAEYEDKLYMRNSDTCTVMEKDEDCGIKTVVSAAEAIL